MKLVIAGFLALILSRRDMKTWQIWAYEWVDENGKPIPKRVLFGGQGFPTKGAAEAYWYDTAPGRNDKAVFIRSHLAAESGSSFSG